MISIRRLAAVAVAAGLALSATALPGRATASSPFGECTDSVDGALPFAFPVGYGNATGHYALPEGEPVGLVAMFHGYGHTSTSWKEHAARVARELGVIAFATDYRGTTVVSTDANGIESSRGWQVLEGAEEMNLVTQAVLAACPSAAADVVAFGVSMGGNASGLAVAAGAQRPGGGGLYDWWFNIEGATNALETYLEARALGALVPTAANASVDIEREAGCKFEECPERYEALMVVNKADRMKAAGLQGVVMVHGLDDGLVGTNQTEEMGAALALAGISYEQYTPVTRGDGEAGTTLTGYALNNLPGKPQSPLAGHASERSTTHVVMVRAFERLTQLFAGDLPNDTSEPVLP